MAKEGPVLTPKPIQYVDSERPPTAHETALWEKASRIAKRVNLISYAVKSQYQNILTIHKFAQSHQIAFDEPDLPDLEKRMLIALAEIESLKDRMCGVNQLELGVRLSSGGNDLDIVEPSEPKTLGWVLPAVMGVAVVIGIIARWAYLEKEVVEIRADYNGIIKRADMKLCGPGSNPKTCLEWQTDKKKSGYFKRESLIESIKNAAGEVGKAAKTGLGPAISIAIPLLLWMYLPKNR
jgi:hypothetical protein